MKSTLEENMINIDNIEQEIVRIIPISRLMQMMVNNTNTLVKPKLWDDPYENIIYKTFHENTYYNNEYGNIYDSFYGQCWSLNTEEENGLSWRIYSSNNQGVMIKTTIKKLLKSILKRNKKCIQFKNDKFRNISCYIGKVIYYSQDEIEKKVESESYYKEIFSDYFGKNLIKPFLIKRNEFENEKEIRLIYRQFKHEKRKNNFYHYNIDMTNLIDEIIFNPNINLDNYFQYKKTLRNLGYSEKIKKSQLYNIPDFDLDINFSLRENMELLMKIEAKVEDFGLSQFNGHEAIVVNFYSEDNNKAKEIKKIVKNEFECSFNEIAEHLYSISFYFVNLNKNRLSEIFTDVTTFVVDYQSLNYKK